MVTAACAPVRMVTPAPPPSSAPATGSDDPISVAEALPPAEPIGLAPEASVPLDIVSLPDQQLPPPPAPPEPRQVAILFDDSSPDYAAIASHLVQHLTGPEYEPVPIDMSAGESEELMTSLRHRDDLFAVAIGLPAARLARDGLSGPVVFAQVFHYQELLDAGRPIRGVAAMPPLELQVREWKQLDPDLSSVGLIVSEQHVSLLDQAEYAASSSGLGFRHEISASDQETLYLFKRLASEVDGFWLVPDGQILSPDVVHELLAYATSHGVGVTVFNDTLLDWGALQRASGTREEVARTIRLVLDRMVIGGPDSVANLTPLSEFEIRINPEVAVQLGLAPPPQNSWIVR